MELEKEKEIIFWSSHSGFGSVQREREKEGESVSERHLEINGKQ